MVNVLGYINNSTKILEDNFSRALEEIMAINSMEYDKIAQNLKGRNGKLEIEYDIVLFNSSYLFILEVKRKPHINDFKQLLEQKESFPKVFKGYDNFQIHLEL